MGLSKRYHLKMVPAGRPDGLCRNFRPLAGYCIFLLALFSFYLLSGLFESEEIYRFANWFGPVIILVVTLTVCYKLLRANTSLIWTPLPWFLSASAVYFGFGPLLYTFGNWSTVAYADSLWPVHYQGLFRINMLNSVGMATMALSFLVFARKLKFERLSQTIRTSDERTVKVIAVAFLCIGATIKYGLSLPYEFGMTNFVLPGSVYILEQLTLLALLLFAYLAASVGGKWKIPLIVFIPIELMTNLLRFSKISLLLVIFMPFLGWYMARKRIRVLIAGAALCALAYVLVTPIVTWSRDTIEKMNKSYISESQGKAYYKISLSDRVAIALKSLTRALTRESDDLSSSGVSDRTQAWWARLDLTAPAAFAMREYDMGRPSTDFSNVFWTLVPRFIWPDKPELTKAGYDFAQVITGDRTTSLATGLFADGYYNGGWVMVIIVCCIAGGILAFLSRLALIIMQKKAFLLLPCVFMGMQMGFQLEGRFVTTYVGPSILFAAYFILALLLFVKKSKKESSLTGSRAVQLQ